MSRKLESFPILHIQIIFGMKFFFSAVGNLYNAFMNWKGPDLSTPSEYFSAALFASTLFFAATNLGRLAQCAVIPIIYSCIER